MSGNIHDRSLAPAAFCKTGLGRPRITRHAITEYNVKDRSDGVASRTGNGGRPFRVDARHFDRAQKIEYPDNENEGRVLEQADTRVDDVRYGHAQRLRKND